MEQNEALQPTGDAQSITVAGVEGRSVALHSVSPLSSANGQPQRERDWLVTVPQHDGSVIFLVFVAPQLALLVAIPTQVEGISSNVALGPVQVQNYPPPTMS